MKVQGGQIHPKSTGTTLLGKSLDLKHVGEGLGECRGEDCPLFIFFARRLLWPLLVTAAWASCTSSLTQTNFSDKPRLPRSLRQPIYNTRPIKTTRSVAAVNATGGSCSAPVLPGEGRCEGKKGGQDRATRWKPALLSWQGPAVLLLSRLLAARSSFVTTPWAVAVRPARSRGAPGAPGGGSRAGGRRA